MTLNAANPHAFVVAQHAAQFFVVAMLAAPVFVEAPLDPERSLKIAALTFVGAQHVAPQLAQAYPTFSEASA